ncbi:SigE family RNA polymerase sigma factor [Actinomadura sp. 3N508]|uniref:SigE family RNA polymerase sigma factor n=1 Tax=Actinomadura sp. 3N508 TaxID=3375153 RepID=UPI00379B7535
METEEAVAEGAGAEDDDPAAPLVALFADHHVALVRMALLIVGDRPTAEDVVQEVFIAMHGRLERLHDHDRMLPYARKAVINRCRTALRRRKLAERLHRRHYEPPVWSAESAVLLDEEHREVLHALRSLPGRQREVLVLRFYLGLDEAQIAEVTGISCGTVKSTSSRALAALARKLGEDQ